MTETAKNQSTPTKAQRKAKLTNAGWGVLICALIIAIYAVAAVPTFLQQQKDAQHQQQTVQQP